MTADTAHRWFTVRDAVDQPLVRWTLVGLAAAFVAFPLVVRLARPPAALARDLWDRYWSWLILAPMMFVPVLLGAAVTIAGVGLLSVACYHEFARASGLFRYAVTSATVAAGLVAVTFAVADHWWDMFVALPPIGIAVIAATALLADHPADYIQRVALGTMAFLLFGVCLGHLGYLANDRHYRPVLVWLVLCVQCSDIAAYSVGKAIGGRKLAPNTSPNKTVGGAVGALAITTLLAVGLGYVGLAGTRVNTVRRLIPLGLLLGASAQLGDLTLSSVKRNLQIKDWAATFPGHGGLLDRFNSLLFAAPAALHYIGYYNGIGLDQPAQIFTGGGA